MLKLGIMLVGIMGFAVAQSDESFNYRNDSFYSEPIAQSPQDSSDGDSSEATSDATGGDVFGEELSEQATSQSLRPRIRGRLPALKAVPADLSRPVSGGRPMTFTNTSAKDRRAPIFPKIQEVMKACGQGCDAAWAHCYRNDPNSCHHTGDAMDMHGLICNGKKHGPTSKVFRDMVACIKRQSYRGTRWRALHMETTKMTSRDCRRASSTNMATSCHWDHVHLSVGCWRNGRKKY